MNLNVYFITNIGTVKEYYHFLLSGLFPLLYYDIKTNHIHNYTIKTDVGSLYQILKIIFNNRISANYINHDLTKSDKEQYWDIYINLLKNTNSNDMLCEAYDDVFYNDQNINTIKNYHYDSSKYKKLKKNYIDYYYWKNKSIKSSNYDQIQKMYHKNKIIYKQMRLKRAYLHLCKIKPYIINFFKYELIKSTELLTIPNIKIILIERKIPKTIFDQNASIFTINNGARRLIYNHKKLKHELKNIYENDFLNITLEDLNIYDQFNLFNNASVIIGQHGAGLTNIFFCKPNTQIIEILPYWKNYYVDSLENLSKFNDLNYSKIIQNRPTKKDFIKFNNKYKLFEFNDDDDYAFDSHISKSKFELKPVINFIRSSGNVNINAILELVALTMNKFK